MDLNAVLKMMETGEMAKTAADNSQPETREAGALANAIEKAAQTAPASNLQNPANVLMNMAESLAGAEKEAEVEFAALCGQAFGDAVINKFAAYNAQAQMIQAQNVKEASASISDDELVKVAATEGYNTIMKAAAEAAAAPQKISDNDLVKFAADAGYSDTMEKAAADYQAGQQQALKDVHSLAVGEFLKGAAETEVLINQMRG